ncbi:unannotated protein [freshwater metagenome]|uniref:Unannotated protein n=1 Tax=freshwater metagenome TaxID=449393 RepID=A0A6J6GJB8_9ZZZZ
MSGIDNRPGKYCAGGNGFAGAEYGDDTGEPTNHPKTSTIRSAPPNEYRVTPRVAFCT